MAIASEYVDWRNGAYYLAGSRIGLSVLYHEFMQGLSAEEFFKLFPHSGSLATVYGAIAFMLSNPEEVKAYLAEQDRQFEELKKLYPTSPKLLEAMEQSSLAKSKE